MNAETSAAATERVQQDDSYVLLKDIEIKFIGQVPRNAVTLRIQVDDTTQESKPKEKIRTVKWNCEIYVSQRSRITLSILRVKKGIRNPFANAVIATVVLEAGNAGSKENTVCSRLESRVRATFTFGKSIDRTTLIDLLGKDVKAALASKVVLLDKMKTVSTFAKVVFSIGENVSELNDIAKLVFGLANKLFKVLQEQQEFHHMAVDLAESLNVKLHISDIIPERLRQGSVQKSLKALMDVIEETLKFIKDHIDSHSINNLITRRGELTDLKAKLFAASEDLSLCLTANVLVMVSDVHENMHDTVLEKKLKPVLPARTSIGDCCLEGTRKAPLENVMNWAKDMHSSSKLYHIHGVAGSGKSSMASTICQELEEKELLGGAFFCKRDIPDQRDPRRVLPSLSYTLALRHKAYRERVMLSLKDEPDITSRTIEQQLKALFRDPLVEPLENGSTRPKPFTFVIDALDECGDNDSRSRLANSLRQIAILSGWLKVFITSRPTEELIRKLQPADLQILSVNLNAVDSDDDIKLYTRTSLKELVDDFDLDRSWWTEETIDQLSKLAAGLFIWISTMIKYVRNRVDKDGAMELVLSGKAATAESSLDDLYRKVIESSGSDSDDLASTKVVLEIISITARNRPLSIEGLFDFLQATGNKVSQGTLKTVINRLRSVLYEDASKGNVLRVCHPSFLDFLGNRGRSVLYWTNTDEAHAAMAEASINLMKAKLRFNICGLKSSFVANKDVGDITQKIKAKIPESLVYSCLYWTTHLTEANRPTTAILVSELFQCSKAIYWIEVLSLVDGLKIVLAALHSAMDFFNENQTICSLAMHLHRFVSLSYDAISLSTPHLYISALAWLPEESLLRSALSGMRSNALISTGRNKEWTSMLWMATLGGHVWQVKFSPDSKAIAACSEDGNICIFNAETGVLEWKLQGSGDLVWAVAFSPDGKRLASGSADRSVIIWDLKTGDIVKKPLTGHSGTVTSVAYSPDGCFIASRSMNGEIRTWDAQSGASVRVMKGCRAGGRLAYSHDGTKLACCGLEGIVVRDAQSGMLLNELSNIGHILDVTYSQDGRVLASGGRDLVVRVWDAETLDAVAELNGHASYVFSVYFSSDGSTLLSASSEGKMMRWNVSSYQMNGVAVQESDISTTACSSDGHLYASGSADGNVRVWNADSHFNTESSSVNSRLSQVACSPGTSEIASASSSGEIRIHSFSSGRLQRTLRGHTSTVKSVVYSPDGTLLASGSYDCTVRLWEAETGLELRKFEGHTGWVVSVVFLPDGKQILSSSVDGTVRRWNIDDEATSGEILHSQTSAIWCMCTSQNRRLLAFGDCDGCIQFGDVSTWEMKELRIESNVGIRTLAFSPDETYLASGSVDNIIRLWHLETEAETKRFEGHTDRILSVSFSRDGKCLLSSSGDITIRQWCIDTGKEIRQLKGHTSPVSYAVYSENEEHIISCSDDGTIRIWNADVEEKAYIPQIDKNLYTLELDEGWIKSKNGELLLWVPSEYRNGFKDMCERCIPADAPGHPVRLDWPKLVGGENWTDVLNFEGGGA